MLGITVDGAFSEYCIVDARSTVKIPPGMSFEQASSLMCAGVTIYSAIRKAEKNGLRSGGVSVHHLDGLRIDSSCNLNRQLGSWD